jgi:hypothetical protein
MRNSADDTRFAFAHLAVAYYGLGRFAALTHTTIVSGNLLHHAVEMIIKAALARSLSLRELKDLRHSLTKLWAKLKPTSSTLADARFRRTINQLDVFERLRYPDVGLKKGYEIYHGIFRGSDPSSSGWAKPAPNKYILVLNDVDSLFAAVFRAASLNPPAFIPQDADRARWIKRDNPEVAFFYP